MTKEGMSEGENMKELTRTINCKTCGKHFADLLLDESFAAQVREAGRQQTGPDAEAGAAAEPIHGAAAMQVAAHLAGCATCREELEQLQATYALLDSWTAPEPSAFFDSRLHVRLREVRAEEPERLWSRVRSFFLYSTRQRLRPVLAGALAVAVIAGGGGTFAGLCGHQDAMAIKTSPTVNDLKILDNNAQALQQMDELLDSGNDNSAPPVS